MALSWRNLLGLSLLLLVSLAGATDRLAIDQVRFSSDGSQVMVLSSGVLDGSGFARASLTVLRTRDGVQVYAREITAQNEDITLNDLRGQLLRLPASLKAMQQAGVLHARTSSARYTRLYPAPYPQWSDGVGSGQRQVKAVKLWSKPVPVELKVFPTAANCPYRGLLPDGEGPAGFQLMVGGQVVHLNRHLPAGRVCAARYSLERVDVQGNRALFTLRAYQPGFEGPDAVAVFVAVTLK